jgi:hypothetical protein
MRRGRRSPHRGEGHTIGITISGSGLAARRNQVAAYRRLGRNAMRRRSLRRGKQSHYK